MQGFATTLKQTCEHGEISEKVYAICLQLYESYAQSITAAGQQMADFDPLFYTLLTLVKSQISSPYQFEPYHKKVTEPFNYYRFGMDFLGPLIDKHRTYVEARQHVDVMEKQLKEGANVILFANHQTEIDPQLINLALEESHPEFVSQMIFVAGDRVLSDPMAVPFSIGCNLLCIYSKRHIDNPPELKEEKLLHNQRTMKRMREMLSEGGKCIYVAPSGGRDRPNQQGEVVVAPFDPSSVEMFRLMAKQAKRPVHFYPLSLLTYDILPPPQSIESELGEVRRTFRNGALFAFGDEIDMESLPGADLTDRQARRSALAMHIWSLVKNNYGLLKNNYAKGAK